ncbi:MAG: outer membrane beta-barrel protein [Bacteroidota bacterium]
MKKILIAILFISQFSFGQSVNRQYIGLSVGPSFPLGDFKKAVLADSTSGFAKTGIALSFDYAYRFTHNFGMMIVINYSGNSIDNISYKDQLEDAHPGYGVSVESTYNWSSGGIFLGPYLRFPLTSKLSWDIRALGGYFNSYSPRVLIRTTKIDDPNVKGEYYIERSRANNFGYMLGTGFKYKVNSYYVLLFGDYVSSSLDFKNATGWDWDGKPFLDSFSQKVDYITLTIGVGYIL